MTTAKTEIAGALHHRRERSEKTKVNSAARMDIYIPGFIRLFGPRRKKTELHVNWSYGDIRAGLLTPGYEPDFEVHEFYRDVERFEVAYEGYAAGGVPVPARSVNYNVASKELRIVGGDCRWPLPGMPAVRYIAIYERGSSSAYSDHVLLFCVDLGSDFKVPTENDFLTIGFASGLYRVSLDYEQIGPDDRPIELNDHGSNVTVFAPTASKRD